MQNRLIIEAANATWNEAFNSKDMDKLSALYAENATLSPGNGKVLVGRAEIRQLFNSFIEGGVHHHTLEIIEVGGSDNLIYQVAKWSAQGAAVDGKTPTFGGITTSVLEQNADGMWLTRTHIWNSDQ
jgi:uncharacterized protein (TIGR02246 family)